MNNKIFIPIMAVAFGLLLFSVINSNTDYCITCGLWANSSTETTHTNPDIKDCQFGVITLTPDSEDVRCMYEDEYYRVLDMIDSTNTNPGLERLSDKLPTIADLTFREDPKTCVLLDGIWWCTDN